MNRLSRAITSLKNDIKSQQDKQKKDSGGTGGSSGGAGGSSGDTGGSSGDTGGSSDDDVEGEPVEEKTQEEIVKEKMLEQATQTELQPEQKITPVDQEVQAEELLDDVDKKIAAPSVDDPVEIDGTKFNQTPPAATPAETYRAEEAAPKIGDAEAAQGNCLRVRLCKPRRGQYLLSL